MELDLWIESEIEELPTLKVREWEGEYVLIGTDENEAARLNRDDVKLLYLSLKYWYDLVTEEVARVLPLHQSPQAAVTGLRCRRCGASPDGAHEDCAGDQRACQYIRVGDPGYDRLPPIHQYATNTGLTLCTDTACTYPFDHRAESHAEHDPEPQAVGHPEAPAPKGPCQEPLRTGQRLIEVHAVCGYIWALHRAAVPDPEPVNWSDKLFGKPEYEPGLKFDYCTECGHSWGAHLLTSLAGPECTAQLGKDRCGCEAIRADQVQAPVPSRYDREGEPVKAECTCRRHEHRPGATRRCAYPGCFCRRQS